MMWEPKPKATECHDCKAPMEGAKMYTEINPPGGYGREHILVCDDCMRSGRWDEWKSKHWTNWPNWPNEPRERAE